jgi:hypothetical protein
MDVKTKTVYGIGSFYEHWRIQSNCQYSVRIRFQVIHLYRFSDPPLKLGYRLYILQAVYIEQIA